MTRKFFSIKYKIILINVIAIFVCSFLVSLFSYNLISKYLDQRAYENKVNTMIQAAKTMTEKSSNLVKQTHIILENDVFQNTLEEILLNPYYNYATAQSNLQKLFNSIRMKDRCFDYFYLYTDYGTFSSLHTNNSLGMPFDTNQTLSKFKDTGLIVWEDNYFALVIPKRFSYIGDALLFVKLDQYSLRDYLYDIESNIFVVNGEGEVIIGDHHIFEKDDNYKEIFTQQINKDEAGYFKIHNKDEKEEVVFYATIENTGWKVVSKEPTWQVTAETKYFNKIFILAILFGSIVSVFFGILINKLIVRPLNQLTATMKEVRGGNLGIRFNITANDEIGLVGSNFNYMLEEIERLIIKVEQEQKELKKMEIDLLQSQINPHFLYNTLDTIYWKICLGDDAIAKDMVIWLAKILRIGLSKGKEKITIEEELIHIEHYLKLQQMAYNHKFDYSIEVPDYLKEYKVVKIILQPLIENSVNHGFKNIEGKGLITIQVSERENNKIEIIVKDNGTGIDIDKIESGYGLGNTIKRLQLYYGVDGVLSIYPQDKGVLIKIVIPKER